MADILLIHGAMHGAWCWRDLLPELALRGHRVHAIDLPGHGGDMTPISKVTLEAYSDAILDAIERDFAGGPVVLVGHSMAGYPISCVAERAPEMVARLVYLCAYVPAPGQSLADMRKSAPRQPLMPALIRSEDGKSFRVDPAKTHDVFYHDCPEGTTAYANMRLCAQAVAPQAVPCEMGESYARVKRSYIRCMDDRTIPPEFQVTMTEDWPAEDVYEMETGHSPFFAAPQELARLLTKIAAG